jgi:hypothetical protein
MVEEKIAAGSAWAQGRKIGAARIGICSVRAKRADRRARWWWRRGATALEIGASEKLRVAGAERAGRACGAARGRGMVVEG